MIGLLEPQWAVAGKLHRPADYPLYLLLEPSLVKHYKFYNSVALRTLSTKGELLVIL